MRLQVRGDGGEAVNLDDAIQQARDAASAWNYPLHKDTIALRRLVSALDDALPHLVDTRRLAALAPSEPKYLEDVCLSFQPPDGWCVLIDDEAAPGPFFATAAEALDAAEREAQQ